MKKLYFLFFIILSFKTYGQTYSFSYSYSSQGTGCTNGSRGWEINISNTNPYPPLRDFAFGAQYPPTFFDRKYTVKSNPDRFIFELIVGDCAANCNFKFTRSFTLLELIKTRTLTIWDCLSYQRFAIDDFKPNIFFKNLDNTSPNEICAGYQIGLAAFPTELLPANAPDFPTEVYHWKYSLDNGATFKDVPAYIGGKKTNYIATTRFSIQELLGDDHVNYLNKTIYFGLAYGGVKAIPIKYSPCAPTITNITYECPKCSGDPIQKVDVTFDRPLYPGESLDRIKMKNILNGSERNEFTDISSFSTNNPKVYSFTNLPNALENAHTYKIVYQAQMIDPLNPSKKIMKGFMESASNFNFTYTDPPKVQFKITNHTEPSCAGEPDGTIEIEVLSGRSPYHFYKDGIELTGASQPSFANGKYYITGLNAKEFKIMVTDAKGCIEKNKND